MNINTNSEWQPKDWERHVNNLLRTMHGKENYIKVPDEHGGDAGVEGFSLSGNAYQCYAPDELCSKADLCEKQKKKITQDIKKFIENKGKLESIFGDTKIRRWILVVPKHISKDLIAHANKKALEVVAAGLSYVNDVDFRLLIWDREEFSKEELELIKSGLYKLKIHCEEVPDSTVDEFRLDGDQTINNMNIKLGKLAGISEAKRGVLSMSLLETLYLVRTCFSS